MWKVTDTIVILPILLTLICFVLYWFVAKSSKIKALFYKNNSEDEASVNHIFFTKYFGFISMGIIPAIICFIVIQDFSFSQIGLTFISETSFFSLVWIIGLSTLVIPLASFSARKPQNLVNYPQIRAKNWTKVIIFKNLLGWALYLFGYELLFRGILFMMLVEPLGLWAAIAINVALYSVTHIPKGLDETIGAILLGLVLCLLTAASGTIWIAFFVHLAIAWTNSLTALKYHPEIHYKTIDE